MASPVILTPTGGASPSGSFVKQQETAKAAYTNLDKFYEDIEETEGSDESESEASDGDEEEASGSGGEAESTEEEDSDEADEDEEGKDEHHVQGTTR